MNTEAQRHRGGEHRENPDSANIKTNSLCFLPLCLRASVFISSLNSLIFPPPSSAFPTRTSDDDPRAAPSSAARPPRKTPLARYGSPSDLSHSPAAPRSPSRNSAALTQRP